MGQKFFARVQRRQALAMPAEVLKALGLEGGDHVHIDVGTRGRLVVTRADDFLAEFTGVLPGLSEPAAPPTTDPAADATSDVPPENRSQVNQEIAAGDETEPGDIL